MPYPKQPKQPNPDPEGPGGIAPIQAPTTPKTPQAVAGAPKLPTIPTLPGRIPRPAGVGGPENWDRPARDLYSGQGFGRVPMVSKPKFTAKEAIADQMPAVERLDTLLAEKMSKLSPSEVAKDPFWSRFQSLRTGYAAEILADVVSLLSEPPAEGTDLSEEQQAYVKDHPLSKWMSWWKPGGADMLGL